jgi:hypothetical protein
VAGVLFAASRPDDGFFANTKHITARQQPITTTGTTTAMAMMAPWLRLLEEPPPLL